MKTLDQKYIDLFDDFLLDKGRLIDNKLFTYQRKNLLIIIDQYYNWEV